MVNIHSYIGRKVSFEGASSLKWDSLAVGWVSLPSRARQRNPTQQNLTLIVGLRYFAVLNKLTQPTTIYDADANNTKYDNALNRGHYIGS
jgi:hypothetical protein